jgi:KEOPS complex subunit Cgi121
VLKRIQEFGNYVEIIGFKNVKIRDPLEFLRLVPYGKPANVETQFFDARNVVSWQHLYFAALNALTAFDNKTNRSKTLGMETLLYAAGERQITKATDKMGINSSTKEVAVLTIGKDRKTVGSTASLILRNVDGQRDDRVLELSGYKIELIKKAFGIGETELETVMEKGDLKKALIDLVIERMALVSSER